MKLVNLIALFSFIAVIIVLVNISTIFIKISEFKEELSGFASSEVGYINITIETLVSIDLNRSVINWSSGAVDLAENNATLYTQQDENGTVLRGNWTGENAKAIIVENVGTSNVSLYIMADKDAKEFFESSTNSNQEYKWNITNKEVNSCTGGISKGIWREVNTSSPGTEICSQFGFSTSQNEVYIDVLLTVPQDATNIGEQSDLLTISANAN